ncbi:hypothetical protein NO746_000000135 [Citrobacter freundii]|nr:hypothetical protein [Citrobacter freundii]
MSNINKQQLREEFQYMQNHYSDPADHDRQVIYLAAEAMLDELEAAEKRIAEQNFENLLLANADRDIKALRQRIAELESRTVTLPPRAPENMAACLDGYDKWVIATTFRDTWNACLSEVMRMNAAGIGVKGE